MLEKISKQHNVPWIGPLKDMAVMAMFYVSIINFILISVTAYYTTLRPFLLIYMPWFKIWMFLLALIALSFGLMLLEYKFVYKSYYTFRNKQEFEHENLLRKEIEDLRKDIAGLRGKEDTVDV